VIGWCELAACSRWTHINR